MSRMHRPIVLVIAGSDPSGGAGLQLDLAVIAAAGLAGAAVVSVLTVQTSRGVLRAEPVAPDLVREQIEAVLGDLPVAAVKCGLLGPGAVVRAVADALAEAPRPIPVVTDPVLASSSGFEFADAATIPAYREALGPRTDLLTPNALEAARLLGAAPPGGGAPVALRLRDATGAGAVLVKGVVEGGVVRDSLADGEGVTVLEAAVDPRPSPHGTGCALSTAIACGLAAGLPLREAVRAARARLARWRAGAETPGGGVPFLRPAGRFESDDRGDPPP